ncbi:N-6 DNA methylase [Gilliamella apicola]|uniref:N-6 DNA methylase n=1 Tax=Gilliamella apicola TaxID=1196095 RepID=UPI002FFCFDE5
MLGKMAASGTNGQFRTPRHIIRMMVQLMKPTIEDNICDPAMGSAGFVVESAAYISEHYKKTVSQNWPLVGGRKMGILIYRGYN